MTMPQRNLSTQQNLWGYCSESDPGIIERETFVSGSVSIGAIGAKTGIWAAA
jgi:hypothetical protein